MVSYEDGHHHHRCPRQDEFVKHLFLQLLDYCHSLGTYHRDSTLDDVLRLDSSLLLTITNISKTVHETFGTLSTLSTLKCSKVLQSAPKCPKALLGLLMNFGFATGRFRWGI
jgi:hypothetical protein